MWQAHQHAANADDHLGNGLLIPAVEEHYKAAEAYLAAVERSNDESVLTFTLCQDNVILTTLIGEAHTKAALQ
jgi:hypothetical protein